MKMCLRHTYVRNFYGQKGRYWSIHHNCHSYRYDSMTRNMYSHSNSWSRRSSLPFLWSTGRCRSEVDDSDRYIGFLV